MDFPLFPVVFFQCNFCNFKSSRKYDYEIHLSTRKHKMATNGDNLATPFPVNHKCEKCNKKYADRRGLWSHNKKHHQSENEIQNTIKSSGVVSEELFIDVLKQNGELIAKQGELLSKQDELIAKQAVLEDKLVELAKERTLTVNNNNNTNNQFNLNFYLNTTCKDAINYTEFINSLTVGQEELQKVIENGYVNGHTMIIKTFLDKFHQHERPIQCSDLKRGTVHIKNGNEWFKDKEGNPHIEKITDVVTGKTMQEYGAWSTDRVKPKLPDDDAENYDEAVRARTKYVDEDLHFMERLLGKGPAENKEINKNILKMVSIGKNEIFTA